MAREHHCPNCGPQACNASTSKIHTCGVCAAIWEEDLSIPTPAPAPPRPAAPAPAVAAVPSTAPKPLTPAPAPARPPSPPPAAPALTKPAAAPPSPTPAPPAPKPVTPPPPSALASPGGRPAPSPAASGAKTLAQVVQGAKVKRCPQCISDGVATPLDFLELQGRVVLQDSQTYRPHQWYADTGEPYVPPATPAAAADTPTARPASAPQPSS